MTTMSHKDIRFLSTWHKEDVVLEPCSKIERANMDTLDSLPTPYFYLYLPIIHELGVLIPFTPFKVDFMETPNVDPSKLKLISRVSLGILRSSVSILVSSLP